uniref:Uncharacterized protein n=1 Tax=Anguilla anguilla TaxID=7936 RepID=A0A0E9UQ38_ANGAN
MAAHYKVGCKLLPYFQGLFNCQLTYVFRSHALHTASQPGVLPGRIILLTL